MFSVYLPLKLLNKKRASLTTSYLPEGHGGHYGLSDGIKYTGTPENIFDKVTCYCISSGSGSAWIRTYLQHR